MKAITLTQPWASLVALGEKKIETRSWRTYHRGRLAVSSAKAFPRWAREMCLPGTPIGNYLLSAGYPRLDLDLPLGVVVCTVFHEKCVRMTEGNSPALPERDYGHYEPGRWMWMWRDVIRFEEPFPVRGYQGLWDWDEIVVPANDQMRLI